MAADQSQRPHRALAAGPGTAGVKTSAAAKKVKQLADALSTAPLTDEQAKEVVSACKMQGDVDCTPSVCDNAETDQP